MNSSVESNERRYLVFGGVCGDFNKNTFIMHENLKNFSKSYIRDLQGREKEEMQLPVRDKFYYQ